MAFFDEEKGHFKNDRNSDKRKQSMYFPSHMIEALEREAIRQDRSLSWLVQMAWQMAAPHIEKMPSAESMVSAATRAMDEKILGKKGE